MKRANRAVMAIFFFIFCIATASYANAGDRALAGLAIGGGTGAVIGQAVGQNVESTLLGATVGGAIGLIIGNELGRNHVVVHNRYYQPRHHYRPQAYHPRPHAPCLKSKHVYIQKWDSHRKHREHYTYKNRFAPHISPHHKFYRDRRHHWK